MLSNRIQLQEVHRMNNFSACARVYVTAYRKHTTAPYFEAIKMRM